MHRLKILIVIWFTCAAADLGDREFIPSASMDTEDGWRVMQDPLLDEYITNNPELYLSFPRSEKQSNEINNDFLNNDAEFRIQVHELEAADKTLLLQESDSLPVASSLISKAPKPTKSEASIIPPKVVKTLPFKGHHAIKKPPLFSNNAIFSPYTPHKFIKEPLLERFPPYDMLQENTNLRNYQSLSQFEDPIYLPSFDYRSLPRFMPYRQIPMQDNSVEYYEIDKNARPIILKEEISYENTPSFTPIAHQMRIPRESFIRKPYYNGLPIPISVKTRKLMKKPKRSMRTYIGSPNRGIPIVRGRFSLK